ncbi:MAG: hypothetical protein AAF617_05025 [Bacteroidota bacterium]
MRKFLKHTCCILLAFLVLGSTFSFTINEHICSGVKMSMSIGFEADTCGMEEKTTPSDQTTLQQVPCCSDISTLIQGQDELPTQQNADINTQTFLQAYVYSYIFILEATDTEKTVYTPYVPPPLIRDIQLLDETFLI